MIAAVFWILMNKFRDYIIPWVLLARICIAKRQRMRAITLRNTYLRRPTSGALVGSAEANSTNFFFLVFCYSVVSHLCIEGLFKVRWYEFRTWFHICVERRLCNVAIGNYYYLDRGLMPTTCSAGNFIYKFN